MKELAFSKPAKGRARKTLLWAARCARVNAERASEPPVRANLSSWADSFEAVLYEDAATKKSQHDLLCERATEELAKIYERNKPEPFTPGG